jgi:hypothetical protein
MPPAFALNLSDPRQYGSAATNNELASLSDAGERGDAAARTGLLARLTRCLEERRDEEIVEALRQAPSQPAYRALWEMVCHAVDHSAGVAGADGIAMRLFAMPVVFIAAARGRIAVPGLLRDIEEIRAVLERSGAVGATRNFGLSNALCPVEALEILRPSTVCQWSRARTAGAIPAFAPRELVVNPGREQVRLRFLVGAGITPRGAPSLPETAANIGAWGTPLVRALARQLAHPDLDLLPVPRPPAALLKAAHAGRRAELEIAFNLFVSNALRSFRATVGDPTVAISAHRPGSGGAEIRIGMSSAFDDTLREEFRWPLHPIDDLERIGAVIGELLRDCRVTDVRVAETVLTDPLAEAR